MCAFEPCSPAPTRRFAWSFNPSNGFVCLRTSSPSPPACAVPACFNPSNGFVCLRTLIGNGTGTGAQTLFQSVERICVPSNGTLTIAVANLNEFQSVERICVPSNRLSPTAWRGWPMSFNPSNGFVCLRTQCTPALIRTGCGFNPSNGFVCLRTARVL